MEGLLEWSSIFMCLSSQVFDGVIFIYLQSSHNWLKRRSCISYKSYTLALKFIQLVRNEILHAS